jgi:light-regulated signal transduction histidine kinase (bacteriophytochrome)
VDGILEDVTERRRAERDLRAAHAALEDQARRLRRSNADLQRFAHVVSHDLQEPLRMVATFTDRLSRRSGNRLDGEARRYLAFAREGAGRMQEMIRGLLDFCLVEKSEGRREVVDCGALLDRAMADLRVALREAGAVVTRDPLPTVEGDDVLLGSLFQNLLGNAVKFRRPEVEPRIHVGAEREEDAWVLSVRDNGRGFPPESADLLFQVFRRLPGSEGVPGTGMGLAICERIAARHGGRIWAEAAPGGGSVFRVRLPACAPGQPAVPEGPPR